MTSIALPSDGSTSSLRAHTFTDDPPARANKSTGPRTPEGKARSSQNARKHNLAAATPPPDLNAAPAYQAKLEQLRKEWRAHTPTQELLVDQLALVMWKLEQIPQIERALLATEMDAETVTTFPPTPRDLNLADCPDTSDADPTANITAHHLHQNQPTPLTRLWDHQRRLLARCQSLIRQLQSLQRKPPPPHEDPETRHRRETDKQTLDQELDQIRARNRQRDLDQARERAKLCQSAPDLTPENAPAQNEPLSLPPLRSVSPCLSGDSSPPAQNELHYARIV